MSTPAKATATLMDRMKRAAKKLRKDQGTPHHVALDQQARFYGYAHWHEATQAHAAYLKEQSK